MAPIAIVIVAELVAVVIADVAVEVSVVAPPPFEAVTATLIYFPTSDEVKVYVEFEAPEILVYVPLEEFARLH